MIPSPYCTIGPFFPNQFSDGLNDLTRHAGKIARGQHILLSGRVLEEGGQPTVNTIIEIWQPDANGIFRHELDPRAAQAGAVAERVGGGLGARARREDREGRARGEEEGAPGQAEARPEARPEEGPGEEAAREGGAEEARPRRQEEVIRIVTLDRFDESDIAFLSRTLFQAFGQNINNTTGDRSRMRLRARPCPPRATQR